MESTGAPELTTTFPFDYNLEMGPCETTSFRLMVDITTALYSVVLLLSLVGNSLVLWVLVKYESLQSLTNLFILNLCLSDLLFSCLLPVWVSEHQLGWVLGDFSCKLLSMVFSVSLYSSIFFLTVMTVHRYLSVVSPLSTLGVHSLRSRALMIAAVWVASILSSVPDALFHRDISSKCDYSELHGFLASVYQHNVFFLLSMGVILFSYVQILRTLLRSRSQRRHRTIRLILTIVTAYFLSWAPYNLLLFLETLLKARLIQSCEFKTQLDFALLLCRNLAFAHCCFNPVLYVFVGVKFRRHLKSLLQQAWMGRQPTLSPGPFAHGPGAFTYEGPSFY